MSDGEMEEHMPDTVLLQYNYGWNSVEQVVRGGFKYTRTQPDTLTITREELEGMKKQDADININSMGYAYNEAIKELIERIK